MSDEVLYEVEDGVAIITINRPEKYNALNTDVVNAMRNFFQKAEEDPEVRAVILTGMGEKAFAAGADITAFPGRDSKTVRPFVENGQAACTYIESLSIPTIAAVNGYALGGGCEFAMACDIRYASSNARFGQP
ncbi:MAG: enoyl-CoA hydratase/isomerase family protein, partial [Promethearchaeota archaeon]